MKLKAFQAVVIGGRTVLRDIDEIRETPYGVEFLNYDGDVVALTDAPYEIRDYQEPPKYKYRVEREGKIVWEGNNPEKCPYKWGLEMWDPIYRYWELVD